MPLKCLKSEQLQSHNHFVKTLGTAFYTILNPRDVDLQKLPF